MYEDGFRVKYGTVKKLVGTGTSSSALAYTCTKGTGASECDEALTGTKGNGYRGCQAETRTGKACVPWANVRWVYSSINDEKSQMGYGDAFNYCRNPDGGDTIWCCTTASCGNHGWEYCTPKATRLLEVAAREEARVEAASDELHARASSSANISADALLDQVVSRKGCVETC